MLPTIITNLSALFSLSFMVRAFAAGILIGIIAPLIGTFLVARRYSLIGDTLAHVSLAGVALGLVLNINPILSALIVSVAISIFIDRLRSKKLISGESALAVFLSGGLALAVVTISFAHGLNANLISYLFGSITTVSFNDLLIIVPLGVFTLFCIIFFYRQLLYISLDEESAKASGIPTQKLSTLLMILTAITTALSIRIVGSLLIGALMVIPVVASHQLVKSFKSGLILSVIISLISVIAGLLLAFFLNLPAGGTIVLSAMLIFLLSLISSKI